MKKNRYILYTLLIIISNLNCEEINEEKNKNERGFAFYENNKEQKVINLESEDDNSKIIELLSKILIVNNEIKEILKNEFDPEPKIIKNEKGENCIANSSADCFEMPVTSEAKRIPVYKNWLEKGDLSSSLKKKQWEAKYFSEISNRAYMDTAALTQYGSYAYPVNYNTASHNNTTGYATTILRDDIEKSVLEQNLDKINFIYFIGLNEDLDLYAMDNIVRFLKQFENKIKLQFIFQNEKSKKAFEIAYKHNQDFTILNNYKMTVLPNEFKDFNIYTTPSLVAINKNKKTAQTILTGRLSETQANRMILMYLRSQEIIKDTDLNPNDGWKNLSDYGKNYIKDYLGEDFLKEINSEK